ncbi:MAG: hypothetical protein HY548_10260 [Elusimicrobia bacterium]|nr:hypothetical protein [Elusimicrobiota bacterium]
MMKAWTTIVWLLLFLPTLLLAGGKPLVFPKLEKTAQGFALGESGATLVGLNALGTNPAGLPTRRPEILSQYQSLLADRRLALLGFSHPLSRFPGTLAVSYLNMTTSKLDRRDEYGKAAGDFSVQDQMVALSWGVPLSRTPLALGISVKHYRFRLDSFSAATTALDVGARFKMGVLPVEADLALLNAGQGVTLTQKESPLPTRAAFSWAYQMMNPLALLGGMTYSLPDHETRASLGMEMRLGTRLIFRGRYSVLSGGSGGRLQDLALGLGVNFLKGIVLDYAFEPLDGALRSSEGTGLHKMTMTYAWDEKK